MITKKGLVFSVLVTLIPLAYTRLTSLRGVRFSNDVIKGGHHLHKTHHVQVLENEVDSDVNNGQVTFPKIKPYTKHTIPVTKLVTDDKENEVDAPIYKVCQTVECRKLAKEYLIGMNKSVDPCEDFYEFACGGWKSTNPIPSYEVVWSRSSVVQNSTNRRIKAILESKSKSGEIKPVRQAKKWYRSCMNTERREKRGVEPILSIMLRVGGWPMIMNQWEWHEKKYSWKRVQEYYARLTGSYAFHNVWADYPSKGKEFGDICIDVPTVSENMDNLTISQVAEIFIKYNRASVPKERLLKETQELISFRNALLKLISKKATYNDTLIEKLNDWYNSNKTDLKSGSPNSEINLSSWVQDSFNLANITVHPSTRVWIAKPEYVRGIDDLLKRTSPRTIVNYIHWTFVEKMRLFINEDMKSIFENTEDTPRWSFCVEEMKMKHAISYAYVLKYYPKKTAKSVKEMAKNVREALQQIIDNSNWMDSKTKMLMKKKLKSMRQFDGYPPWYNRTAIINYYKGLEIGSEYLENHLNYLRLERKRKLESYIVTQKNLWSDEEEAPIEVNAWYVLEDNYAEYPAAIFQPPLFGIDYPKSVNYGSTSSTIGHEIGHAFDNCGITYDENGNDTKLDKKALRSFYERVDCFVDQYDEYNGNPKVQNGTEWDCKSYDGNGNESDGQRTAGENIADSTGLEAAFHAYKNLIKRQYANAEIRLPGLEELTDHQLFFLSFAESRCEVGTSTYKEYYKDDEHSTERLRVIGAVSNLIGFAKVFNCPIGSPMNPVNKCSVWNKPEANVGREALTYEPTSTSSVKRRSLDSILSWTLLITAAFRAFV